jgi:uncharacterized protein (TIGR02466 family)
MKTIPIFTITLHKFDEPELASLGKKIVIENADLFIKNEEFNVYNNFLFQDVSKHRIDENYKNLDDVLKFKEKILSNALKVLNEYDYTSEKIQFEVTNLWFNIMENMGYQNSHNHYGYVLTGTFYIDVPEECSPIVFYSPIENMQPYNRVYDKQNELNSKTWTIYPKTGEMYFWLSSLSHGVLPTEFQGSRITCSYDISSKI